MESAGDLARITVVCRAQESRNWRRGWRLVSNPGTYYSSGHAREAAELFGSAAEAFIECGRFLALRQRCRSASEAFLQATRHFLSSSLEMAYREWAWAWDADANADQADARVAAILAEEEEEED